MAVGTGSMITRLTNGTRTQSCTGKTRVNLSDKVDVDGCNRKIFTFRLVREVGRGNESSKSNKNSLGITLMYKGILFWD